MENTNHLKMDDLISFYAQKDISATPVKRLKTIVYKLTFLINKYIKLSFENMFNYPLFLKIS